ncbi:MAG TPA: amidohydrolase family protein [Bryobacteraceae bacterium]|nr:amidohydrolase family protein [Bryobacteraceae bacterium]
MQISRTAIFFAFSIAAGAQEYSVVVAGRVAGKETLTPAANGAVVATYSYNDRGRGPDVTCRFVFDAAGMPTAIDLKGVDYNKSAVDEHFSFSDGVARWKSTTESGESRTRGWYVTNGGPFSETAWLVRALLRSHRESMPLLPGGEATIEKGRSLQLKAHGETAHVTLFSITGLGFAPTTVWLDDRHEFFAIASGFAVVRAGWADSLDELRTAEKQTETARYQHLTAQFAHRPDNALVIEHVRLFDAENATMHDDQTVVISGNRIQAVTTGAAAQVPAGAERINGAGKTLLPGLFDMHAHFDISAGLVNIAGGVTTVRDLGNDMDQLLAWKGQMDADKMIGPRVILAGIVEGRGPYAGPTNVFTDTEDEARAAIERYAAAGYTQIKIYSSVKPALVPFIVRTAHAKGLRVSGHVPAGMIADQFVDAGVDEMQHINFVFLNFWPEESAKTNTRTRLILPAERAAGLDLDSPQVTAFISKLKSKQIVVDPTLGVFEGSYVARPGVASPGLAPVLDRLPVQVKRAAFQGGLPAPGDKDDLYRRSFDAMMRMTLRLYRAGVPLVIGTDGLSGIMLHRELELWAQAGIPPAEVLRMATIGAARVGRVDRELGSIAPGKLADLVLVNGDPIHNISDVRKTEVVIKNGTVYHSAELYRAVGMKP